MKLNYISCVDGLCGVARYLEELAGFFFEAGHQVQLFRKWKGQQPFALSYPHRSLKGLRPYIAPYYLSRAIRNLQADIWHADYVDGATAVKWAGKQRPEGKLVVTAHDAIPFRFPEEQSRIAYAFYRYHLRQVSQLADAVIVVSEQSKRDLVAFTGIPAAKVHVVYNGINHEHFYPDAEPVQNPRFIIRYVGGLAKEHKNARALIETARILERKGVDFILEIGSGNAQATPLPELVKRYGLKSVRFAGFVADEQLRSFLAGADLFLFPSLYEGFGFPPLEAMACGTPVVSSGAGSLTEVLADGALITEAEPEAFAQAIEQLINDRELLKKWRNKGLEKAAEYTWQRAAAATLKVYEQL